MTQERIRNATAACVVGLTRHVMSRDSLSHEAAYRKVFASELFKLLSDPDTRLCYEPNSELARYLDVEDSQGIEALYAAIEIF
jgi:hypothetical protein